MGGDDFGLRSACISPPGPRAFLRAGWEWGRPGAGRMLSDFPLPRPSEVAASLLLVGSRVEGGFGAAGSGLFLCAEAEPDRGLGDPSSGPARRWFAKLWGVGESFSLRPLSTAREHPRPPSSGGDPEIG